MICPHCQKEIDDAPKITFDFEEVYKLYPKKLGKSDGIKRLKAQVKTPEQFEALKAATKRFAAFHQRSGTEPQYIPYFSSFVSNWRDWLLPDTGTVKVPNHSPETTAAYLDRAQKKKEEAEEEWPEQDPEKVRQLIAKTFKGMPK